MRHENFINTTLPETGSYDECLRQIVAVTVPESQKEVLNAFNRKSLLEAYKNGEKRVIRIVYQKDENDELHKVAIEDYFMESERNNDVYVVSFIQNLDFEDGTYV
jgi:hypothetical protein